MFKEAFLMWQKRHLAAQKGERDWCSRPACNWFMQTFLKVKRWLQCTTTGNKTLFNSKTHTLLNIRESHLAAIMGLICIQSIGFTASEWGECMSVEHMQVFTYACVTMHTLCRYVCVCRGLTAGLKPLRAVYTNTPTKDTSCCQTGREIYLPDSLEHLGPFRRKQATGSRQSGTQNCCHIAALNPQLVSECTAAYALGWKQRRWRAMLGRGGGASYWWLFVDPSLIKGQSVICFSLYRAEAKQTSGALLWIFIV